MASLSLATIIGIAAAICFILTTVFATAGVAVIAQRHNYRGDLELPLWLQSMLCASAATLSSGIIGFIAALVASFTHKKQTFIVAGIIGCAAGAAAIVAVVLWSIPSFIGDLKVDGHFSLEQTRNAVLACMVIALICSWVACGLSFAGLMFGGRKDPYPDPQLGYYHRRSSGDFYTSTVPGAS